MDEHTEASSEGQQTGPPPEQGANAVTEEMIARRAYEISQGEDAGTPEENWARAERELSGR